MQNSTFGGLWPAHATILWPRGHHGAASAHADGDEDEFVHDDDGGDVDCDGDDDDDDSDDDANDADDGDDGDGGGGDDADNRMMMLRATIMHMVVMMGMLIAV
eukprot:4142194-Pyramimonas_sp.AAC.1